MTVAKHLLIAIVLCGCSAATPEAEYLTDDTWLECRREERGVLAEPLSKASTNGRQPVSMGQMTEKAAEGKRLYDSEKYAEARPILDLVARGDTGDDAGNRQVAAYYVAIASYRLHDYQSALSHFAIISTDPLHLKYEETLLWLSLLAKTEVTAEAATDLTLNYHPASVARFDNPQQREAYGFLLHTMGRAWYRRGDVARARRLLARVPTDTEASALAQRCLMQL